MEKNLKLLIATKKSIITLVALLLVLVLSIIGVSTTDAECVFLGKSPRRVPIYCVDTQEKIVALSFDATWGADKTLGILDVLKEYGASATFFAVGMWVEKYSDKLKILSDSGIMEIGTHSNNHPDMAKLSRQDILLELETSVNIIENVTGGKVDLFRAPYGSYSDTLIETAEELGLFTIQWDVDTLDWKGLSAGDICQRVLNKVKPGSIVLMHNDGENTLSALPLMLEGLKQKGYKCVKIGDMIYRKNFTVDHTGKQIRST